MPQQYTYDIIKAVEAERIDAIQEWEDQQFGRAMVGFHEWDGEECSRCGQIKTAANEICPMEDVIYVHER